MSFESREPQEKEMFSVRDAIAYVRSHVRTYSDYRLRNDIGALSQEANIPSSLREKLNAYNANARSGIAKEILDAIIERALLPAPEGYEGLDEIRKQAQCSAELVQKLLPTFLNIHGFSDDVLTDIAAWHAGGEELKKIFLHARSRVNGSASVFFSPEGQKALVRFIAEHKRKYGDTNSTRTPASPIKTPLPKKSDTRPASPKPEQQNPVAPLLTRLAKINPNGLSSDAERKEAQEIAKKLREQGTSLNPHDGQHYAKRITELENSARRNSED